MTHRPSSLIVALASLTACSAVVGPPPRDAAVSTDLIVAQDVSSADASSACTLSNGARCELGQTCPSPDGCNTCVCEPGGLLACTLRACVDAAPSGCVLPRGGVCAEGARCPAGDGCNTCQCSGGILACTGLACADAGARVCTGDGDCDSGQEECVFVVGDCAGAGRCSPISDCADVAQFCGCDGQTFRGCVGRPRRPARSAGGCASDGGVAPDVSCAGASIAPNGRECVGPSSETLPVSCCTGWSCDERRALCDSIPPTCPRGWVPVVSGGCWGPCVPVTRCAPMRCLGAEMCPPRWRCNDADSCEYAPG